MISEELSFLALLGYVFLQNARPDKAAVLFAALDQLSLGDPKGLRALALARVRSAKPARALDALDRLAMAGGVDAAFHLLRAQALTGMDRREEAVAAMNAYLQLRGAATVALVEKTKTEEEKGK